jgi:hypothetical protein
MSIVVRREQPTKRRLALAMAAIFAVTAAPPAVAHADDYGLFLSPSGNIACSLGQGPDDMGSAGCEVREHLWVAPATTRGPWGRPCDFNFGGLEFMVDHGQAAVLGCYEGVSTFAYPGLTTLDYGQTRNFGPITCDSERNGVTCTDTSTGHFFRVSRESYLLG